MPARLMRPGVFFLATVPLQLNEPAVRVVRSRIYGCDDCLAICPWNKFAQESAEIKLKARQDLNAPSLAGLAALGQTEFRSHFSGSPIKRIGWPRFLRNVLYAVGNSGDAALLGIAQSHTGHPDPVIADAANWAVQRLTT